MGIIGKFVLDTVSQIAVKFGSDKISSWLSKKASPQKQFDPVIDKYLQGRKRREEELINIQNNFLNIRQKEFATDLQLSAIQVEKHYNLIDISEKTLYLKEQELKATQLRISQEKEAAETQKQQTQQALQLKKQELEILQARLSQEREIATEQKEQVQQALYLKEREVEVFQYHLAQEQKNVENQQHQMQEMIILRQREIELMQIELQEKYKLGYLQLELMRENEANALDLQVMKLKNMTDLANWAGLLSRQDIQEILVNGQKKHRLLVLLSPPEISKDCPDSFLHNLEMDVRNELRVFMEKNYSMSSETCPVEFYGKYFKHTVPDTEIKQLEILLDPVPAMIVSSSITDQKIYFYIKFAGMSITEFWDWREKLEYLKNEGYDEENSHKIIRQAIVKIHQLIMAYLTDLYYMGINPVHIPRVFQLEDDAISTEWLAACFKNLKDFQEQQLASLNRPEKEMTICFIGKTGSGKSTLINAFYNWCLGIDGEKLIERKYCITTRSQSGRPLQADKKFSHLNTENLERQKGASSTLSPSKYTFEIDELIVNVIDTPGFADTTGVETDREHMRHILEHITEINEIHLFGIVWNEKRLTAEQKFVIGSLKELLPKDHYANIVVCVTNTLMLDADTNDAISEAGLGQCPMICFDNAWVTTEKWDRVSKMYRREADGSFYELLQLAKSVKPVSNEIFHRIAQKKKELERSQSQIYAQIATLNVNKENLKKVIRELDDLSKDIKNITITRVKISAKETPAQWNTYCQVCGSNCHVNCGLGYKHRDLSECSAMNSDGNCNICGHRHTVHTHECTKMDRKEIREEITDHENLKKKTTKENDLKNREILKEQIKGQIDSLDYGIEEHLKKLRKIIDELSLIVMAPFNPHYLDYLQTLEEAAKQEGDIVSAKKIHQEIDNYSCFIKMIKRGVEKILGYL